MESSINDNEENQSFRSPPRRRRSTFFERRDSIVPAALSDNVNSNKKESDINERHTQDMSIYYEKLLTEKEMWKKEVNDRRNKYHDLRRQYQMAAKGPKNPRMLYSALSNEDIEFLKAKPNLSKLVDSQQSLHESLKLTKALYRRANELDDVILTQSENVVNRITDYILENSTIEPVD